MTDGDVKQLIGHMVLQMRAAEMALEQKDVRIAELEAENTALKASKEKKK